MFEKPIYKENINSFKDIRGEIWTSYNRDFDKVDVNHVKFNTNNLGVFRGFHTDSKTIKIASCISGKIIAFIVWPDNSRYMQFQLCADKHSSLLIPAGFYNGFLALEKSIYVYQLSYPGEYFDVEHQRTLSIEESCVPIETISSLLPNHQIIRSSRDSDILI